MKRVTLIIPSEFDIGTLISLVGSELVAAYIGPYNPKVKPSDSSGDGVPGPLSVSEPLPFAYAVVPIGQEGNEPKVSPSEEVHIGQEKEIKRAKGEKRPGGEGRNQPVKLEGFSLKERALKLAESGDWVTGEDFAAVIVPLGYNKHSAYSTLSALKILGQLERVGKGLNTRYRKPTVLQAVKG
jgi:hypothetical protein